MAVYQSYAQRAQAPRLPQPRHCSSQASSRDRTPRLRSNTPLGSSLPQQRSGTWAEYADLENATTSRSNIPSFLTALRSKGAPASKSRYRMPGAFEPVNPLVLSRSHAKSVLPTAPSSVLAQRRRVTPGRIKRLDIENLSQRKSRPSDLGTVSMSWRGTRRADRNDITRVSLAPPNSTPPSSSPSAKRARQHSPDTVVATTIAQCLISLPPHKRRQVVYDEQMGWHARDILDFQAERPKPKNEAERILEGIEVMSSQPRADLSLGRNRLLNLIPPVHIPQPDSQRDVSCESQVPTEGRGKRPMHPMMPRESVPHASQPPVDQEQNQQRARRKRRRSKESEEEEQQQAQPICSPTPDQDIHGLSSDESEAESVHVSTGEGTKRRKGTMSKKSKFSKHRRIALSDSDDDEPRRVKLSSKDIRALGTQVSRLLHQQFRFDFASSSIGRTNLFAFGEALSDRPDVRPRATSYSGAIRRPPKPKPIKAAAQTCDESSNSHDSSATTGDQAGKDSSNDLEAATPVVTCSATPSTSATVLPMAQPQGVAQADRPKEPSATTLTPIAEAVIPTTASTGPKEQSPPPSGPAPPPVTLGKDQAASDMVDQEAVTPATNVAPSVSVPATLSIQPQGVVEIAQSTAQPAKTSATVAEQPVTAPAPIAGEVSPSTSAAFVAPPSQLSDLANNVTQAPSTQQPTLTIGVMTSDAEGREPTITSVPLPVVATGATSTPVPAPATTVPAAPSTLATPGDQTIDAAWALLDIYQTPPPGAAHPVPAQYQAAQTAGTQEESEATAPSSMSAHGVQPNQDEAMDVVLDEVSVIASKPAEAREQAQENSSGTTLNKSPVCGAIPASTSGPATDPIKAVWTFKSGAATAQPSGQPASNVSAGAGTSATTAASTAACNVAAPPMAPFTFSKPTTAPTPAAAFAVPSSTVTNQPPEPSTSAPFVRPGPYVSSLSKVPLTLNFSIPASTGPSSSAPAKAPVSTSTAPSFPFIFGSSTAQPDSGIPQGNQPISGSVSSSSTTSAQVPVPAPAAPSVPTGPFVFAPPTTVPDFVFRDGAQPSFATSGATKGSAPSSGQADGSTGFVFAFSLAPTFPTLATTTTTLATPTGAGPTNGAAPSAQATFTFNSLQALVAPAAAPAVIEPASSPSVRVENLGVVGAVPDGLNGGPNMFNLGSVPPPAQNRNVPHGAIRFNGLNVHNLPRRARGGRGQR